jgi:ABC-type Zn2+ transport system substrate-binding protein/surface adhesin
MGMVKKLMASGIAAKLIQEARKPENQAKIKQAISDFQAKRANQARRPGTH